MKGPLDHCKVNVYWMGENVTGPTESLLLQTIRLQQTHHLTPRESFEKSTHPLLTLYPSWDEDKWLEREQNREEMHL